MDRIKLPLEVNENVCEPRFLFCFFCGTGKLLSRQTLDKR